MLIAWSRPGPEIEAADGPFADAVAGSSSSAASAATAGSARLMSLLRSVSVGLHRPRRAGSDWSERQFEILEEVLGRLEADGEPDEIQRGGEGRIGRGRVGHARRKLDQALHSAE